MKFRLETQKDWEVFSTYLAECKENSIYDVEVVEKRVRTKKQNASLWKWLTMLSEALNDAGYDRIKTLQKLKDDPNVEIPNDKDSVYEDIWMKIQGAVYPEAEGSSDLETTEVSNVYEIANRYSVKLFGISIPWPDRFNQGNKG